MRKLLLGLFGLLLSAPAFAAALPAGYTQLEYVDMNAGSYLLTDLVPTYDSKIEMEFQTTTFPASGSSFFGARSGGPGDGLSLGRSASDYVQFDGFNGNRYTSPGGQLATNTRYKYVWNNKVATIYQGTITVATNTFTGTGTTTHTLAINGLNNSGSVVGNTAGIYLYSFKMWNAQGELIADYVPAKQGNTVGFYDMVSESFKGATSGTFIAGPDAGPDACPNGGVRREYVSATGTGAQVGTPTPDTPIEPTFYHQGRMILRAVGTGNDLVADTYNASTGKITRNVGVKVLDGTENYTFSSTYGNALLMAAASAYWGADKTKTPLCTHYTGTKFSDSRPNFTCGFNASGHFYIRQDDFTSSSASSFKQYLADQYAAGTPVTIWYPLETPVEETWTETSYCASPITIATKSYVNGDNGFGPSLTNLLNTVIPTITGIVSSTVTQATSIGTLATGKQTRPDPATSDGACPAG